MTDTKVCSKCKQEFPLTNEFWHRDSKTKDGFFAYCKECNLNRNRQWKKDNPQKQYETNKKWRQSHSDKDKEYGLAWARRNRDSVNAKKHRYRARKKNADGSYTLEQIQALYEAQNHRCYHCDIDLEVVGKSLDHLIPLSRGGSNNIDNLGWLCPGCNSSKRDKMPWEWDSRYCE